MMYRWAGLLLTLGLFSLGACNDDSFNDEDAGPFPDAGPTPDTGPFPDAGGVIPGDKEILLLRGTVVTPETVLPQGEVLTQQDTILCVAASCAADPKAADATVIETNGIIYPGLVDSHNHTQYNYMPLWKHSKMFTNHNQWAATAEYHNFTDLHHQLEGTLMCEMSKYGEIRSLVAGTTIIQGTPYRKCVNTLIRNADLPYHGFAEGDTMYTNVGGVDSLDTEDAQNLLAKFQSGDIHAYMIHLAEGIDETARKEFDALEAFGMLQPQVVVIHGTALGTPELTKMKQAGMPLIWSPSSNLDLYGATNDIATAWNLGLLIALAPDWTPSGEPNILDELQLVWEMNTTELGVLFTAKDLVEMVTSKAAEAMKFEKEIGALKPGMRADLLVLAGDRAKPYDALVTAELDQVRLVVVRGRALYGEPGLMTALEPNTYCETVTICGAAKVICVKETETSPDKLDQTLGDIITALETGYTPGILSLSTCK
jgi:5-methylthioadenosine/S-adenosylhomocysteine deaminase